jgi:osmotically-inducible protein OsmY
MKHLYSAIMTLAAVSALSVGANAAIGADARIESAVHKSFVYRHYLKNDDIKVKSKDGVVVLTGSVSEDYHKTLANDAAAAQTGVSSVDDRLAVKAGGPAAGSDAWLIGKVKAVLLFHRSVSAVETTVDAKDGIVTLRGSAESTAQKDLTSEYAGDVDGVKSVDNELTVAKAPSRTRRAERGIDDASITAEVKLTLLFHRSTSALSTQVRTAHGVITLSGKAATAAEKDLAGKIAGDVKGAKSVTNDIRVE